MSGGDPRNARRRWRERWRRVHLWLGLSLGTVFALLGLTGSLLVYYTELDAWLNPPLQWQPGDGRVTNWDGVWRAIERAHPDRPHGWRIELPPGGEGIVTARYLKPVETRERSFAPLLVSVHPRTHAVVSQRFWGEFAMTWVYDLHYTLLMGTEGRTVVGVLGLALLASLGTGVVLWWPRSQAQWGQAWTAKGGAARPRRTWDQHRLMGVYGSLVLAVLAGTGVMLALPQWVEPAVGRLSPVRSLPSPTSLEPEAGAWRLTLDEALSVARARLPGAVPRWVDTPDGPLGTFRFRMQQAGEPSDRFPRTFVWVDAWRPQVLAAHEAAGRSGGEAVLAWLHPLHNGEAFGAGGRALVAVAGLVLPALWVTGLVRWRDRARGRAARLRTPDRRAG